MRKYLTVICALALITPATADARTHHHRHLGGFSVGMGDVSTLGCDNLPLTGSTFVRVIVGWQDPVTRVLPCAQAARAAGLRVELVIQWGNAWTVPQIRSWFEWALALYGNVHPFAVGVGNEQEGPWNGGPAESGAQYAAIWRMVEPMVARAFPHAIRVAGEISPWGNPFMLAAANAGLPGAQAYATHAYPAPFTGGPGSLRWFKQIAAAHHARAWADEGLCGPDAWMSYGCSSATELKRDGFSLGAEWYLPPFHAHVTAVPFSTE